MFGPTRRLFRVTLILACILVSLAAFMPQALAAPKKQFTATISPTTASVQTPTAYVVTITNSTQSQTDLGSANITFPTSFTSLSTGAPTAPAGKSWTASLSGNTVQLRSGGSSDKLTPGQSVSVGVTATATSTGVKTITVVVKQSNNFAGTGNDFSILGAQPTVTVGGAATLCTGGPCSAQTSNFAGGPTQSNPVAGKVSLETGSCPTNDCFLVVDNRNCAGVHGCVNNEIFFLPPSNQTGVVTLEYLCDTSVCSISGSSFKEDENGVVTPVFDCTSSEPDLEDLPCISDRSVVGSYIRLVVLFGPGDPRFRTG